MVSISRGAFLKAAAAATAAVALASCSTGSNDDSGSGSGGGSTADAGAFPVTLTSPFGETVIESAPETVVGIGWINAEIALSLGVVPAGSGRVGWGENANGSTDWFDAELENLGGEQPVRYSETDGINYEEIAKLSPDVILAVFGTMDQETFDKLAEIAPVVTYSEDFSSGWTVPWQDATRIIGTALGRSGDVDSVVSDAEQAVSDAAAERSQIEGATFIASALSVTDAEPSISLYVKGDGRADFLTSLGMTMAPVVTDNLPQDGSFYLEWSNERASELQSDMLYSWIEAPEDAETIRQDSVLSQIPAVAKDAAVLDAEKPHSLAMGYSALGVTWLVQESDFLDQVADAVDNGQR